MSRVQVTWIGHTDLKAATVQAPERPEAGLGQVAQAAREGHYDLIVLLSDHIDEKGWRDRFSLEPGISAHVSVAPETLSGPTKFGANHLLDRINAENQHDSASKQNKLSLSTRNFKPCHS